MRAGLRSGELDDRITIEYETVAKDADFGSNSSAWTTRAEVWADFNPLGGEEYFKAQQITARRTGSFTIRHLATLAITDRIQFDGDLWNINRILPMGRKEKMVLFASARDD